MVDNSEMPYFLKQGQDYEVKLFKYTVTVSILIKLCKVSQNQTRINVISKQN